MKIMKLLGVVWLVFCLYHLVGVATGRVVWKADDIPAAVVGGVSGGLGAWYFRERPVNSAGRPNQLEA